MFLACVVAFVDDDQRDLASMKQTQQIPQVSLTLSKLQCECINRLSHIWAMNAFRYEQN